MPRTNPSRRLPQGLGPRFTALAAVLLAALLYATATAARQVPNDSPASEESLAPSRNFGKRGSDSGYRTAATCCPGCSYYSGCCCAPSESSSGPAAAADHKATKTATKRVTAVPTESARNIGESHALFDREEPAHDADQLDRPTHSLYARNLCPVCPSGCPRQGSQGSGQGAVTVTVTITGTGSATPTVAPGTGLLKGQLWYDNNKDGKFTPGRDALIASRWILVRNAKGTIIARARTDADGRFSIKTAQVYQNERLSLALLSAPQRPVAYLTTSASGNAVKKVPVPPAKIQGRLFVDITRDGSFGKGDAPVVGGAVKLRFLSNSTVWKTLKTDAQGQFSFEPNRFPYTQLVASTGKVSKTFRLDGNGNGEVLLVEPPAVIRGLAFMDADGDRTHDAVEQAAANHALEIRFANGRSLANVTTDSKGNLRLYVYPYPSKWFHVYDKGAGRLGRRAVGDRLAEFKTDASGNAVLVIPVASAPSPPPPPPSSTTATPAPVPPPPAATSSFDGFAFFDDNGNGVQDTEDMPYQGTLVFKLADGSVYARVSTEEAGAFLATGSPAHPHGLFQVYDENDRYIRNFTADADGNVNNLLVGLPVSQPPTTTVRPVPPPPPPSSTTKTKSATKTLAASTSVSTTATVSETETTSSLSETRTSLTESQTTVTATSTATQSATATTFTTSEATSTVPLATSTVQQSSTEVASTTAAPTTTVGPAPDLYKARIAGDAWWDLNRNGVQDAGEPAAQSLPVVVNFVANGSALVQGSTDAMGKFYEPALVVPGARFVAVAPDGTASKTFTTDIRGNGTFKLALTPAQIQGYIWHDLNSDGVKQASEPALWGVSMQLVLASNASVVLGSFVTNSTGGFSVAAAKYPNEQIQLVGAPNMTVYSSMTLDAQGNATILVALAPGVVSGTSFWDLDLDGQMGANEVPAVNVSVVVTLASNSAVTGSGRTDSQGAYSISQVAYPGANVKVTAGNNKVAQNLTLDASGSGRVDLPLPPVEIRGSVWFDADKNGAQGAIEPALNNTFVDIKFAPTGVVLGRADTNATGAFVLRTVPYPNTAFTVVGPQGVDLKTFMTDAAGTALVPVAVLPPNIAGRIFWDIDGNANFTSGVDKPVVGERLVVLLPDGSVYANLTTAADGSVAFDPAVPLYNQPMSVARNSDLATVLVGFSTDALGNGKFDVVLAPAVLQGVAWIDVNKNGAQDTDERPLNNSAVDITWPNGTLFIRAPTDAQGALKVATVPQFTQIFVIRTASGSIVMNFTTDDKGSASIQVPIPAPLISGQIWYEVSGVLQGATFDPSADLPVANMPLQLRFANGSLYLNFTTDPNGLILLLPSNPATKVTVTLVDPKAPSTALGTIALDEFGAGHIDLALAPPQQYINVTVFFDNNGDGTYNAGDAPYQQKMLLLRLSNGSTYMSGATAGTGTLSLKVAQPQPSTTLSVYAADAPDHLLGTFTTSNLGGGSANIPLARPTIAGTFFWDFDLDKTQSSGDLVLSGEAMLILLPSGVTWANITTAADGSFSYAPAKPVPGGVFSIMRYAARSWIVYTFTADAFGSASFKAPLQPAVIRISSWHDLNLDGLRSMSEPPLANTALSIVFPEGKPLASVQTNATGYAIYTMVPMPNTALRVAGPTGTVLKSFGTSPSGDGSVSVPILPPTVYGSIFWDMDLGGTVTNKDKALASELLVALLPDGSVWANATTSYNGSFIFTSSVPAPKTAIGIARASTPGVVLATITTDAFTFAYKLIPLVPGRLTGQVWIDYNVNKVLDAGEPVRSKSYMDFRLQSGELLGRVATDADGFYNETVPAYPNANVTVFTASGSPVLWFFTDSSGNAAVPLPIPPPIITGKMFLDGNNNGLWDPFTDVALSDRVLGFKFLNGSVYSAKVTTDPNGEWLYLPSIAEPFHNITPYEVSNPSKLLGNWQLDQYSSGDFLIAVPPPPPSINVSLWFAYGDGQFANGIPYGKMPIVLRFSNGTTYLSGTTLANGSITFGVTKIAPGEALVVAPASDLSRVLGYVNVDNLGAAQANIPISPQWISGSAFFDFNSDGIFTSGVDSMASLKAFDVKLASGGAYASVASDLFGAFLFLPSTPMPNTALTFVAADTKLVAGTLTTDSVGGGNVVLALRPAVISGAVCLDTAKDGACTSKDVLLNNSFVDLIRMPSGAFVSRLPTDASGRFTFSMVPEASSSFALLGTAGTTLRTFSTDAVGNASLQVPIAPALLTGKVFYDLNQNGMQDQGEPGYINKVVDVSVITTGALLASVPTDAMGAFSYPVYPQAGLTLVMSTKDGLVQKVFTTDISGNGQVIFAILPAIIQGTAFYDVDKDGVLGAKDILLANSYLDIRWPGTNVLLERLATDANGAFLGYVIPNPSTLFNVVGPKGEPWMNFTTDMAGNAQFMVPIPVAYIQGIVYRDTNLDSSYTLNEFGYTNFTVTFKFSNGTIYRTIATDPSGQFAFVPSLPARNSFLTVIEPVSGKVLGNVTLDIVGSGFANLPIPPAGVMGRIFFDMDKNGAFSAATDASYGPGQTLYLLNKDGSIFMSATIGADGSFAFIPDVPATDATFDIVAAGNTSAILATNVRTNHMGAGSQDIPIAPPQIVVTIWYDTVEDGVYGAGDSPVKNEVLQLLRPDGLVYASGTMLVNGSLIIAPKNPTPFEYLDVYRTTMPGVVQGSLITDARGNGVLNIKLSPGHLSGVVYWDVNRDYVQNAGDQPFTGNGSYIDIKFSSGVLLSRVPLDANGAFTIKTVAYPSQTFMIVLPNGVSPQNLYTDFVGDGFASVAIQPATVDGTIWRDYNADRVYDAMGPDKPLGNLALVLRTASGATYATVRTDANGNFVYTPALSLSSVAPQQALYVVDPTNNKVYGNIRTDMFGSGRADMPLPPPPPVVTGYLMFDMNINAVRDPSDVPYTAGKNLALVFANGTTYLSAAVSSTGNFTFQAASVAAAARNEVLTLVATANSSTLLGLITTDPYGEANQDILLPPPALTGTIFYDLSRNLAFDYPPDVPATSEVFLLKMSNGTIFANVTVDANGNFRVSPSIPTPLDSFTVVRPSQTNLEIAAIKMDALGNGNVVVALPPGVLSGVVWTDYQRNNQKDASEPYYANTELHLIFGANGTELPGSPVVTNATGGFELVTMPYLSTEIRLIQANGDFIKSFTTNSQGSAVMIAPIPPPTTTSETTTSKTTSSTSETTTKTTSSTTETTTKTTSSTSETTSKTTTTSTSTSETTTKTTSSTSETTTKTTSSTSETTSQTTTSTSETTSKTTSSTSETTTKTTSSTSETTTKTATTTKTTPWTTTSVTASRTVCQATPAMTLVPPSYAPACPSGSTLDILQSGCVPAGITDFSTTYLDVYMPTDNPIVELSVYYACQHTYDGDLKFTLLTPWGGSVLLTNKRGAGGDNYNGTVFSTTCATSVTAGAAPFANCYKPEESLSTLSGNSTFGRWSLKVEDVQASDVGYSTAFAVLFCT